MPTCTLPGDITGFRYSDGFVYASLSKIIYPRASYALTYNCKKEKLQTGRARGPSSRRQIAATGSESILTVQQVSVGRAETQTTAGQGGQPRDGERRPEEETKTRQTAGARRRRAAVAGTRARVESREGGRRKTKGAAGRC
jgi:hypothetical protein